jgi:rubrerythrin
MKIEDMKELLLQALEVERGGVKIYQGALECVENDDLKEEWEKYLEQTRNHVQILERTFATLGLDTEEMTPGRKIVGNIGAGLAVAIQQAKERLPKEKAQVVAAECIVFAETKDHMDWELIGECAGKLTGEAKKAVQAACDEIEDQEDEHLYHTKGWCRELWMESLGMKAVLPPPEERKHVKTAIGAARAEQSRKH